MKLWLISQTVNDDYDTFDAAIVAAETEDEARRIHPGERGVSYNPLNPHFWVKDDRWAKSPDQVEVKFLGEAREGIETGVILASFNAG